VAAWAFKGSRPSADKMQTFYNAGIMGSVWSVEFTDQFEQWWHTLTEDEQDAVTGAVEILEERGPGLGRPLVDTIEGSRHANIKELRAPRGNLRVLFAFDPRRTAILLIGGDKTNRWDEWYEEMIPVADGLFDAHLIEIEKEKGSDHGEEVRRTADGS